MKVIKRRAGSESKYDCMIFALKMFSKRERKKGCN